MTGAGRRSARAAEPCGGGEGDSPSTPPPLSPGKNPTENKSVRAGAGLPGSGVAHPGSGGAALPAETPVGLREGPVTPGLL